MIGKYLGITFILSVLCLSACGGSGGSSAPVSLRIADNATDEGDAGIRQLDFTVTLNKPASAAVSVDYTTVDGSALAGSEYRAVSGTLTIPAGAENGIILVSIIGDTTPETNRSFTIELSNPSPGILLADSIATGTIVDDDSISTPQPELGIADSRVVEGDSGLGDLTFVVGLSVAAVAEVTVDYASADGTALDGVDYHGVSGTLTIPAGTLAGTVTVPVIGNTLADGDRGFEMVLSNASPGIRLADFTATGLILDDDGAPPASGTLDRSFAANGYIVTDLGAGIDEKAYAAAIDADGRILLAGRQDNDIAMLRLDENGNIDPGFGAAGSGNVVTRLPSLAHAYAVTLQADGKILLAGTAYDVQTLNRDFVVLRYLANGDLDPSFGAGGWVTTDFAGRDDYARALAIDSAGRIVVAGNSVAAATGLSDVALARYDANGSLDTGFSGDGRIRTNLVRITGSDDDDIARALVIGTNDSPTIAGESGFFDPLTMNDSFYDFLLIRYTAAGQRDTSFGPNGSGVVTTDFNGGSDAAYALTLDAFGRLVAAGRAFNGPLVGGGTDYDYALARYDNTGLLDSGFDGDGKISQDFFFDDDYAFALALQADGKIVAAGTSGTVFNTDITMLRFDDSGMLDTSLIAGGLWGVELGDDEEGRALVIDSDGKLQLGGFARSGGQFDFATMRINP